MRIGSLEYDVTGDNSGLKRVMAESIADAEAAARTIGSLDATVEIDATMKGLLTKAAEAEAIIKALDGEEVDVEFTGDAKSLTTAARAVKKDISAASIAVAEHDAKLAKLRSQYNKAASDLSKLKKLKWPEEGDRLRMAQLGKEMDLTARRVRALGGDVRDINIDVEDNRSALARWLTTLGKTRVNIGPFSTSLRGLAVIFGTLGPVIMSVVGVASALIGVLGTGLAGAAAVSAGALGGFGLAALGLLPSLKQLFAELKTTPSIVQPLQQMRDTLTAGIRKPFFETAHQAIRTLQTDFPTFQRGATQAFSAATGGFQKWLTGMRSPEARQIIQTLLTSLTNSLPPLMEGLGHIGTAVARIGASGSKFLPGLNQGFNQWAMNLERSVGSGNALDQRIGRLVSHMRDLGHFAQASGRLLVGFFGAGANTGAELLKSMTATFNRWTEWMHTVEGQKSLQDFFQRSSDLARQLAPAIGRIATAFANLSTAAAPFAQGVATGLNALAGAAAAVPPPLLQAAGAAFILRAALGKLVGTAVIGGLVSKIGELTIGGATLAETLGGVGAAAAPVAAALAPAAAVFGATVVAGRVLSGVLETQSQAWKDGLAAQQRSVAQMQQLTPRYQAQKTALEQLHQAQDAYNKSVEQSGKNSHESTQKLIDLNNATKQYNQTLAPLRKSIQATFDQGVGEAARSSQNLNRYLASGDTYLTQYARSIASARGQGALFDQGLRQNGSSVVGVIRTLKGLGVGARQVGLTDLPMLNNQLQQFNQMQQAAAANLVNSARAMKGFAPIAAQSAGAIGKFIQTFGQVKGAKRAVISTNAPQKAAEIAKLSNQLNRLGAKKAAVNIIARGEGANKTIDGLQKKVDGINRKRGVAKVDAKDNASGKLDSLKGKLDQISKAHDAVVHLLGAPAAAAAANTVKQAIDQVHGKDVAINVHYNVFGKPPGFPGGARGGVAPAGFPSGGMFDSMMQRAYERADRRNTRRADRGLKVREPTYITGEERRTEYIIATNPAYRKSNLAYLQAAARDLGQAIIPGYKKGKKGGGGPKAQAAGKKKKGKGKGPGPDIGENLDSATGPDSEYARLENLVQFDAGIVDLYKNKLETGAATVKDVQDRIGIEIADYGALAGRIAQMLPGSKKEGIIPVPPKPGKHAKGKKKKSMQRAHDQAVAHNEAMASQYQDLLDELRTIQQITIPQLQLDQAAVATGGSAPAPIGAQTLAFNQARMELYRNMGSNISQIIGTGLLGTAQPLTPGTIGYFPGTTVSSSSGVGTASSGSYPGGMGPQGNTFINNFAAPPPDPFTWTQQQQFTVQAVG